MIVQCVAQPIGVVLLGLISSRHIFTFSRVSEVGSLLYVAIRCSLTCEDHAVQSPAAHLVALSSISARCLGSLHNKTVAQTLARLRI